MLKSYNSTFAHPRGFFYPISPTLIGEEPEYEEDTQMLRPASPFVEQ